MRQSHPERSAYDFPMSAPLKLLQNMCTQNAMAIPLTAGGGEPWRPLRRSLVHKSNERQVLLTAFREDVRSGLLFDVRGARERMRSELDDAGFAAEVLRQSTIALAHIRHGVGDDRAFLMDRMSFRIHTGYQFVLPTTVRVGARDVVERADHLQSLTSVFELRSGGEIVASGEGYLRVVDRRVYRRIRGRVPLRRASSARLRSARPVTIRGIDADASPSTKHWSASIDSEDPFFFDHEVDHVPGMAIYETACAAASLASGLAIPRVVSFDGLFHQFVELDEPLQLATTSAHQADRDNRGLIDVEVSSKGRVVMSATVSVVAAQAKRSAE